MRLTKNILCVEPATFLPDGAMQQCRQLGELGALVFWVARGGSTRDTGTGMRVENIALDPGQRGARGLKLGEDIDAVAPVLDHRGDPPHLALDAAQARQLAGVIRMRPVFAQKCLHGIRPDDAVIIGLFLDRSNADLLPSIYPPVVY
jgi:hypothetical protein